jgi:LacI family repressor for deo operon, udp, cdd, tsx, nupC, and nupG
VPLVALCETIPGADIPQIEVENRAAARAMTLYPASLGHRSIAYLCGPSGNVLEHERFRGYCDGLREAGLSFDRDLVWSGGYTLEAGIRAGHRIVERKQWPSAVFCSNDETAIGLMRALTSAGIRVPQDISVTGFDDIEFAAIADPALTTVHQPRQELGRAGAEVLVKLLRGETVPSRIRLPTEIIVCGSTGPRA